MKHLTLFLTLFASFSLPLLAETNANLTQANALIQRLIPSMASKIKTELLPEKSDRFELESVGADIVIRGNNANSIAVGLNHYLKYYCHSSVSWYADNPINLPKTLPKIPKKITKDARCDKRFFVNYCTFGYTMPWWQWDDWERFIDWMALNGVTCHLLSPDRKLSGLTCGKSLASAMRKSSITSPVQRTCRGTGWQISTTGKATCQKAGSPIR